MATSNDIIVVTTSGAIRGQKRITIENIPFVSFHGIPYGKPPIGALRFKAPQPADNWSGILDATVQTKVAPCNLFGSTQYEQLSNEDCLQLNVYTPAVESTQLLPVMVWIHGGGFACGTTEESIYGPDYLLRNDVVLVTVTYRLGPFGFLSVADPKYGIPGNAGLKDQTLALRWVKANIDRFGGDPNNVTLFGESAGAASVHCHMSSDFSRGLFHRAIMQSGTALSPYSTQSEQYINRVLAMNLGWNGDGGVDAMMEVILDADAEAIALAQMAITDDVDRQRGIFFPFVPCVEPNVSSEAFFHKPLVEHVRSAWANSIPLLIGCNADECIMLTPFFKLSLGEDDPIFSNYGPRELGLDRGSQQCIKKGESIKEFYYGKADPIEADVAIFEKLLSDQMFWFGTIGAIRIRARAPGCGATYLYRFDFETKHPIIRKSVIFNGLTNVDGKLKGCGHAEELPYLFRQSNKDNLELPDDSAEARVRSAFVDIWTSFAWSGKPNVRTTNGVEWKPINEEDKPYKCLQIGKHLKCVDLPEWERMEFWHSLYKY